MLVDLKDWQWFDFQMSSDYAFYDRWDKLLDLYYLSFAAYTVKLWKDHAARITSLTLYMHRVVGVFLFVLIQDQIIFLLFPNIFENVFLFYLMYTKLAKNQKLFSSFGRIVFILLAVGVPKIVQEYIMHVYQNQLSFDRLLITLGIPIIYSFSFKVALYLCVPVAALMWIIMRERRA